MTEQLERQMIHDKTVELLYMMNSTDNPLMTAAVLVESPDGAYRGNQGRTFIVIGCFLFE